MTIPTRSDSHLLLGDLGAYRKDPLEFWLSLGRQSPLTRIRFGPAVRYVVSDPDMAQHILQQNHTNYIKDQRLKKILETGTGPVLATSDGEDWRWRRKLMQPTFKRSAIAHFSKEIVAQTQRIMGTWKPDATIDIAESMKTLTMNIIGQTMFSVDFSGESSALHHAYTKFGGGLVRRAQQLLQVPLWLPTKNNREFRQSIASMTKVLNAIVSERKQNPDAKADLLNMLLTYRLEEDEHRFSEQQLLYEMSAIVFAGHETTATALTWVFCLLTRHPDVLSKLDEEIDRVLQGRTPTPSDFDQLPYLEQVIQESLRLYPPLYINSRQAKETDVLGKHTVTAGSRILINILGIHRNDTHWEQSQIFDPDRFTPQMRRNRHHFAHLPFLNGPRKCLGATLAMMELQIIVPMVLQQFRLTLDTKIPVRAEAQVVLQVKGGLAMRIRKRPRARLD